MYKIDEGWLRKVNEKLRKKDVQPKTRPIRAMQEYYEEFGDSTTIPSDLSDFIFDWFEANTKPGSQWIGSLFTGSYYFDTSFWPVEIPRSYGRTQLDAMSSLDTMPRNLKLDLANSENELRAFSLFWADCLDYAYGFDDIHKDGKFGKFSIELITSGNKELKSAIAQLHEPNPNPKSIESNRMAVEMSLKGLLAVKMNITDDQAKNIGHNLIRAIDDCISTTDNRDLRTIRNELNIFPDIGDRYKTADKSTSEMWQAYKTAQIIATTVVRILSGRDIRSQLRPANP